MRRLFVLLLIVLVVAGCAAPHAVRVRCDRHLTAINPHQPDGRLPSARP